VAEKLPPPLPPETRTVGQLVAETIRFYGRHFWKVLPLGLSVAVINQLTWNSSTVDDALIVAAASPLMAAAYVRASMLVLEVRPSVLRLSTAVAVGAALFLPAAFLALLFVLPALAWLALVGLAVPVLLCEPLGPMAAIRRARELALADYVHVLGGIATLVILVFVTKGSLVIALHGSGNQTKHVAAFLADLVISPILFVGTALLYFDQRARLESRHADLHPAVKPDRPRRADAEVEPRAAPRGQP
jgi:hypothetical protein